MSSKYICPICYLEDYSIWNHVVIAKSLKDAEDKIMQELCEIFEELPDTLSWIDFIKEADQNDILIGELKDIEEL